MLTILWNKLSGVFITVGAIIAMMFAIFFAGKQKGKAAEEAKQTEESLKIGLEIKADEEKRRNADNAVDLARARLRKAARDR